MNMLFSQKSGLLTILLLLIYMLVKQLKNLSYYLQTDNVSMFFEVLFCIIILGFFINIALFAHKLYEEIKKEND